MAIDLRGVWHVRLTEVPEEPGELHGEGDVTLPGCVQAQGLGYHVDYGTPWMSGLHNPFWYEREEYLPGQKDGCQTPFLSQPPMHYMGVATYEREVDFPACDETWTLHIELTRWRTTVWLDEREVGDDESLCCAHEIALGHVMPGMHTLRVAVDNRLLYPYRPDAHGVSDALGATWNGMAGDLLLLTDSELAARDQARAQYAAAHPRKIEQRDGQFLVDGKPEYFRGTHFGGDYPLTGYPETDKAWWDRLMRTVKDYGLNFIRCHSNCPPETAFLAADEAGVYLQPECGMWNHFEPGQTAMMDVLLRETEKVLRQFGHHPSFVLFSPTNEPSGTWYQPLKQWVTEARVMDERLGYAGRRLYTAQSGWFYDTPPAGVEGVDYLYFHRTAYGPIFGGSIRNAVGWYGKDYDPSLTGSKLPAICHEMGQWCAYPPFGIMEKFNGYLQPSQLHVFRENARATGLLALNDDVVYCSGRQQVRMLKEEIEANLRTRHLNGFELLDLHDYLGQGYASVGLLDAFWDSKGYTSPEEIRAFCGSTVLLARMATYVFRDADTLRTDVEVCHYGPEALPPDTLRWMLVDAAGQIVRSGELPTTTIAPGSKAALGSIACPLHGLYGMYTLCLTLQGVRNTWPVHVFAQPQQVVGDALYTRDWQEAKAALRQGRTVVFNPWLSDLDYDCPPLAFRGVFWNAQMGPGWGRPLGIAVQEQHPLFSRFATAHDGGWQWQEILDHARGFHLDGMPGVTPIVRAWDDWNRNWPLSLLLEGRVLGGRLLLLTAALSDDWQAHPAQASFRAAVMAYANGPAYGQLPELAVEAVERHLFPLLRSMEVEKSSPIMMNPNRNSRVDGEQYPVEITVELQTPTLVHGLYALPVQRDRMFEGCIRDYTLQCRVDGVWRQLGAGTMRNSFSAQRLLLTEPIKTDAVRLCVHSCWGMNPHDRWTMEQDGWYKHRFTPTPMVQLAGLHVLMDGDAPHTDEPFWTVLKTTQKQDIET